MRVERARLLRHHDLFRSSRGGFRCRVLRGGRWNRAIFDGVEWIFANNGVRFDQHGGEYANIHSRDGPRNLGLLRMLVFDEILDAAVQFARNFRRLLGRAPFEGRGRVFDRLAPGVRGALDALGRGELAAHAANLVALQAGRPGNLLGREGAEAGVHEIDPDGERDFV